MLCRVFRGAVPASVFSVRVCVLGCCIPPLLILSVGAVSVLCARLLLLLWRLASDLDVRYVVEIIS